MTDLKKIRVEVFKQRPVLGEIYNQFGGLGLKQYIVSAWQNQSGAPNPVLLDALTQTAQEIYGPSLANQIRGQLLNFPLISTIDHLGIWGHPIFVNADVIYSLRFKPDQLAISLATESVSLNNTSSWSGSVLFHQNGWLKRLSFFPDRLKTLPVFSAPAITKNYIEKFKKTFGSQSESFLKALNIGEAQNDFSSQACKTSFSLWQLVFPSAPKLVYLPLESIILSYLSKALADNSDVFSKIILTPEGQKLWQKYFGREHTFMFWGIDGKGRRMPLSVLPPKEQLIRQIAFRQIYPSSPLCFMVLLFGNLTCAGGFTQTTWLTKVKESFLNLLKDLGAAESMLGLVANVPTKNFAESALFLPKALGLPLHPTASDLFLAKKDYYFEYQTAAEVSLKESIDSALPEIYKIVAK